MVGPGFSTYYCPSKNITKHSKVIVSTHLSSCNIAYKSYSGHCYEGANCVPGHYFVTLCVCASRGQKTGQHFRQPLRCLERRVPWRAEAFFTDRTPRDFTVHAWMWFRLPLRENVWGFSPAPIFMKFSTSVYIFLCVEMFCTELYCNPAGKNVEDKRRMYVAPLSEVWLQLYRFSWNSQLLNTFFFVCGNVLYRILL